MAVGVASDGDAVSSREGVGLDVGALRLGVLVGWAIEVGCAVVVGLQSGSRPGAGGSHERKRQRRENVRLRHGKRLPAAYRYRLDSSWGTMEEAAMWSDFKAFLTKSNALALAVGIILGVALGAVVKSSGRRRDHAADRAASWWR